MTERLNQMCWLTQLKCNCIPVPNPDHIYITPCIIKDFVCINNYGITACNCTM